MGKPLLAVQEGSVQIDQCSNADCGVIEEQPEVLEDVLTDAWYLRAPKQFQKQFDIERQTENS